MKPKPQRRNRRSHGGCRQARLPGDAGRPILHRDQATKSALPVSRGIAARLGINGRTEGIAQAGRTAALPPRAGRLEGRPLRAGDPPKARGVPRRSRHRGGPTSFATTVTRLPWLVHDPVLIGLGLRARTLPAGADEAGGPPLRVYEVRDKLGSDN